LLGKNLNLEALRSASLRGDEEQVAKEMNRILSENYDATEGNKIAQQALAKTLGVSVDEMHKMNQTRLLQNQLAKKGITDQDLAQKTLARFRKEGLTEAEAMAKLNEEELEFTKQKGIDAQATTRTLENAKELFMNSLAPLAEKVATAFSSLVNNEGFKTMLSSIAGVLKSIVGFVMDFPKSSLGIGLSAIFGGSLLKAVTGGKLGSSGNPMHVTMSKGGLMSSLLSKITGGGEGGGLGGIKFPKGKGMLKGAGKLAKGVLGKVAAPLAIGMALFDGFKGFNADKSASLGDKFKNAGSSALNGLSFGLLGQSADTISANAAVNGSNVPLPSNIAATTTAPTENEVVTLLKELIVAVKDGGDVYMDGNKVGRSLVLATSNMG